MDSTSIYITGTYIDLHEDLKIQSSCRQELARDFCTSPVLWHDLSNRSHGEVWARSKEIVKEDVPTPSDRSRMDLDAYLSRNGRDLDCIWRIDFDV